MIWMLRRWLGRARISGYQGMTPIGWGLLTVVIVVVRYKQEKREITYLSLLLNSSSSKLVMSVTLLSTTNLNSLMRLRWPPRARSGNEKLLGRKLSRVVIDLRAKMVDNASSVT